MLQRSFNHMARELDGIEMFRKDFINNFSHEFKTPIVSIRGFAHQLQAGGLTPEEEREYIRIIAAESDRLAKMATNILLLSKLENQAIVTDRTELWLDEQLRTCLVVLEKQWGPKEIELNIDLDAVKYCFNEDMLSQLWLNLFSNAIKFTPRGGCISCSLKADGEAVTVVISDNGIGMDEDTRAHIFDKFYQGDTSHAGDGNGIGLTIVSRILVLCKGKIRVESEPRAGSSFTVTLPVTVPTYTNVDTYEK
jgi:signal transduction histidine kinase